MAGDGVTITKATNLAAAELIVPAELGGMPVTVFGEGVEGRWTFAPTNKVEKVILPEGLVSIGRAAFRSCTSLTQVVLPSTLKTIGESAFGGCYRLADIPLNEGLETIEAQAFQDSGVSGALNLPDSVTTLGRQAFEGCAALTDVTIPDGVEAIGDSAFSGCSLLEEIALPSGLTALDNRAFSGCQSLRAVTIPAGVTRMGNATFNFCLALQSLTFPAGLERLGVHHGASGDIYSSAFGYTPALLSVTFLGDRPSTGGNRPFATQAGAAGFDVAPWRDMRREPVVLGLDFDAEFEAPSTILLTVKFDTSAYQGAVSPAPDLSKVTARINNFVIDGVTIRGGQAGRSGGKVSGPEPLCEHHLSRRLVL